MEKFKKYLPVSTLLILSVVSFLTVYLGVYRRQSLTGRAEIQETLGYKPFVSANYYGVFPEEISEPEATAGAMVVSQELLALGWKNENSEVQNTQPPSIAGFATDLFTGNATIGYPLDIPPGRGGLTPSVGLNYSSGSVYDQVIGADFDEDGDHDSDDYNKWVNNVYTQSSQVGLGWNLSGLGEIFRDSSGNYTLILNGQSYRLYRVNPDQKLDDGRWDGEWWRTEPEGFLKIRHRVVSEGETGKEVSAADDYEEREGEGGVDKFEIWDTSGTYYEFTPRGFFWKRCDKHTSGLRCEQATEQWCRDHYQEEYPDSWWLRCEKWAASYNKWVLSRVTDVLGSEIGISYAEERRHLDCGMEFGETSGPTYPRAVYPSEITYSGSKIEFVTAERDDDVHVRHKNDHCRQVFWSERRIEKINIEVQKPDGAWQLVRQYELQNNDYFRKPDPNDPDELHLKLNGIVARGRDDNDDGVGDEALPAYTFSYNDEPNNLDNFRLLNRADNGYGGRVSYFYERFPTADYNPYDGRSRGPISLAHRVKEKRAEDGFGSFYKVAYGYERPLGISVADNHSGFESFGHQKVSETVFAKNSESAVVKTTAYQFRQGRVEGNRFYPSPGKGKIERVEVKDSGGKILSYGENDYLSEPLDWPGKNNGRAYDPNDPGLVWKSSHFVALKEARSCLDPTSSWPQGNKTTYHYEPRWQDGQQFGNLTNVTEYLVSDCQFGQATAYRSTMSSFYPHRQRNILRLPATSQTFACHSGQSGSGAIADCPQPKRLSNSWNIYDGDHSRAPWSPPEKGLLTLSRTLYEFPERVDPDNFSEWRDGRWRVVDVKNDYDQFGNLVATETFNDYGVVSTSGLSWTFSPPGNGSSAQRSEVRFETTYNTFPVETVNPLGQKSRTSYQKLTAGPVYPGTSEKVDHPYLANQLLTQNQNDINNSLFNITNFDNFGRPVRVFLPGGTPSGGGTPSQIIEYRDQTPYIVHRQNRDDKDDGASPVSYQHSWQIYDGIGQLIQTQTELVGDGQRTSLTAKSYNALGQIEKETLPYESGSVGGSFINPDWNRPQNEYTYDVLGRTLTATAPPGQSGPRVTQTGYFGRRTAVLDPNKHLKVSEVDGLGRLMSTQTFLGERGLEIPSDPYTTTRFEYDALDRLTVTTDALGNTAKVFYNQSGQKERSEDPDLGNWSYTYYPTGTLATTTDAKGQVKSFAYDELDRSLHRYFGDTNTTPVASFVYDSCQNGVGRRCSDSTVNNPAQGFIGAATAYTYDQKGRLQSQTKTIEGQTFTTNFAYDAASRLREIAYPDGEKVGYAYNDAGQLVNASGNQSYLASARYNVLGLPEEEVLGSGAKNVYIYENNTFRLGSITVQDKNNATLWSQTLGFDPAGNISHIGYSGSQTVQRALRFGYDALNRLTSMQTEGRSYEPLVGEYRYDELGRMGLKKDEVLGTQVGCQPPTIPGDANCDCRVNIFDLVLVGVNYGGEPPDDPRADLNGDGKVNIFDLVSVGSNYGNADPTKCRQ